MLDEKVQFVTIGEPDVTLVIPAPELPELAANMQLDTVGDALRLNIPPPLVDAELPANVQLVTVGEDE